MRVCEGLGRVRGKSGGRCVEVELCVNTFRTVYPNSWEHGDAIAGMPKI